MKKGYIITAAVTFAVTVTVIYGGCYGMNKYIASCKTCEQFNIDNWEIRTFTDIKNGESLWCNYNANKGTKATKFRMKISPNEFKEYVAWSGFARMCNVHPQFSVVPTWNDSIQNLDLSGHTLYSKQASYKKDRWTMILDSTTTTLWAELIESK